MDKLARKMIKVLAVPAISCMMAASVYAAAPTASTYSGVTGILTMSGITTDLEYSFDKSTWTPLLGATMDVSELAGKTVYVRKIGNTLASDILTYRVPRQPVAPQGFRLTTSSAGPTGDKIAIKAEQEYKTGGLDWQVGSATGVLVGDAAKAGAVFSIRTAATGSAPASLPTTFTVPKRADAPAVAYDEKKDNIIIKTTEEYKIGDASDATWVSNPLEVKRTAVKAAFDANPSGKVTENGEDRIYVYVRTKGTPTRTASEPKKVLFPIQSTEAPASTLSIPDENITDVTTAMEYRVLTDNEGKASGGTATYDTPAWTSVTGSAIDLSKSLSDNSATTPKKFVQVRYKAVAATDKLTAKPASVWTSHAIDARAATPDGDDISFEYADAAAGAETITVAATFQYKIGTNEWADGSSTAISVKDLFPETGYLPIEIRTKATAIVPASKSYKHAKLGLAARPKTPEAKFTAKATTDASTLTGVTTKMEYKDGASWADVGSTTQIITGKVGDATRLVGVRNKAIDYTEEDTMAVPVSETQDVTCEFLEKVSVIYGNIMYVKNVTTGASGTNLGTAKFVNGSYSLVGTTLGTATVKYTLGTPRPTEVDSTKITINDTSGAITVGGAQLAVGVYAVPIVATYTDTLITGNSVQYTQDVVIEVTGTKIATAAIAGVTAPVKNALPATVATAGTGYAAPTITWSPLPTVTNFDPSTVYTATITITPATGYTLNGVAANFFTVAGATSVTHAANDGVITAVFPATAN